MNRKIRESWDLVAIAILSLVLVLSIVLVPELPLRLLFGLPFLLFFPGYVLIAFLLPERASLRAIERIALSLGLSAAITPLVGFALNYTPFGIHLEPVLFCLTAFILTFCLIAYLRRGMVENPYLPFDIKRSFNSLTGSFRSKAKVDQALTVILVVSISSTLVATAYMTFLPRQGESFTEFYILGPGHEASGYPRNLTLGGEAYVYIGLANHEHRTVRYHVQTWLINASLIDNETIVERMYYLEMFDVVLEDVPVDLEKPWTAQWERNYSFSILVDGQYKMWFFCFLDALPEYAMNLSYMQDYAGTPTEDLLHQAVDGELLSLNMNLSIVL